MKFFYIYVLYNIDKNFLYVGYSEDVKNRYAAHKNGEVTSTKAYKPLELIHYEAYRNMKDAKRREEYFKSYFKTNAQRILCGKQKMTQEEVAEK